MSGQYLRSQVEAVQRSGELSALLIFWRRASLRIDRSSRYRLAVLVTVSMAMAISDVRAGFCRRTSSRSTLVRSAGTQSSESIARLDAELVKKMMKLNRMLKGRQTYSLGWSLETLPYQKPTSDWVHHIPVVQGTRLGKLQEACKRLHKATGLAEDAIVTFVLKGGRLGYSAAQISSGPRSSKLPDGRWITRDECTITIKVPDLTFDQLRDLYQTWRRQSRERDRGLTASEEQTLELVREHGDPPPKGTSKAGAYWKKIRRAGIKKGCKWTTVNAPMTIYRRARKKVSPRTQPSAV